MRIMYFLWLHGIITYYTEEESPMAPSILRVVFTSRAGITDKIFLAQAAAVVAV